MSNTRQHIEVALQPVISEEASNELHERIEELRHLGLRKKDAERIAELEQDGAEEDEIKRAAAAAIFRVELKLRKRYIGETVNKVRLGEITPYGALKRLQRFEIADQELDFARFEKKDRYEYYLLCYKGRCVHARFQLLAMNGQLRGSAQTNREILARSYTRLPE